MHSVGQVSPPNSGGTGSYITRTCALLDAGLLNDGATLWFAFLYLKKNGNGTNEKSGFALGTDHLVTLVTSGAQMNGTGNGIGMYSSAKSIQPATWYGGGAPSVGTGTSFANYTNTVFVVGKIVWGATTGDVETVRIWTPNLTPLPRSEADLGTGWAKTMTGVDQTLFDVISIQQRQAGDTEYFDEIRFGATLADVVVRPPPPGTVIMIR